MLDFVLVPLATLHLLAVYVATAAPLVCLWLGWRETHAQDKAAALVGRRMAIGVLVLFLMGAALGFVTLGLILWRGPVEYANGLTSLKPSRYWYGAVELLFSFACYAGYTWLWDAPLTRSAGRRFLARLLVILGSTNLMYHFPTMFVVTGMLSTRPEAWQSYADFVHVMLERESGARILHHVLAMFIAAGVYMMGVSRRLTRDGLAPEDASRIAQWGGRLAAVAIFCEVPAGIYLLSQVKSPTRADLFGSDLYAMALFIAGIVAALGLMHQVAAAALGETSRQAIGRAMILLFVVVLLMSATQHRTRRLRYDAINRSANTAIRERKNTCDRVAHAADQRRADFHPHPIEYGIQLPRGTRS